MYVWCCKYTKKINCQRCANKQLSFFTRGQFWPPGIVIACVRLCVCPCVCVNPQLVHTITRDPFKLGSPNLGQRCKRPWLRSVLFFGVIDLDLQGQIQPRNKNLSHFELFRTITHQSFQRGSPNLGQRCKIPWLRSLMFLGAIDLDLQGQIWLPMSNFLVAPRLEIHNHRITTREPLST